MLWNFSDKSLLLFHPAPSTTGGATPDAVMHDTNPSGQIVSRSHTLLFVLNLLRSARSWESKIRPFQVFNTSFISSCTVLLQVPNGLSSSSSFLTRSPFKSGTWKTISVHAKLSWPINLYLLCVTSSTMMSVLSEHRCWSLAVPNVFGEFV